MFKPSNGIGLGIILGLTCLFGGSVMGAAPDLIVWGEAAEPYVEFFTFAPNSCEVVEGCAIVGTRKLLRFNMQTRNIGDGNMHLGNPANNPLFVWAPCHGHYHFEGFAEYNLLNASGETVGQGRKIGFCIEDVLRWSSSSPTSPRFDCNNQGIQAGWADIYTADLPCQYIDVTDVAPGDYTLQMIVDPLQQLPESDYNNNTALVPVTIPGSCVAPDNDAFASAPFIYNIPFSDLGNNTCATKEAGESGIAGNVGGHSVWYRWVAPSNMTVTVNTAGSSFDTLLAVYSFNTALTLVAENDDIVPDVVKISQVTFRAVAGTEYRLTIDGFDGATGNYYLNIDPPANDMFADCSALTGSSGSVTGWTIGASTETGEPSHASSFGLHSVWYCWQAPKVGTYTFDTVGSDFYTALAVYTGNSVDNLIPIAGDNHSGLNGASLVQFAAVGGTTYHIAISGPGDTAGNFALNWSDLTATLQVHRMSNQQVQISISGTGTQYTVQTSGDLVSWSSVATLTAQQGNAAYVEAAGTSARFYRIIVN